MTLLLISLAPAIIQFPQDTHTVVGDRVVLRVAVTGTPQPKLTWYHNGEKVVADYSKELAADGTLTMPSAEEKYSGVYKLVVQNPAGKREREVQLLIEKESKKEKTTSGAQLQEKNAIPLAMFGSQVEKFHANQNQAFRDQYQVVIIRM